MIVECPSCGTKNRLSDTFHAERIYRCGSCKAAICPPLLKPERQNASGGDRPKPGTVVGQSYQNDSGAREINSGQEPKEGKTPCLIRSQFSVPTN